MPALVQSAPPLLPSTLSSSSLSSVARGKKRARFADDEAKDGSVLKPVIKVEDDDKSLAGPRKVAKAKKAQAGAAPSFASLLADNGERRP